MAQVGSVRKFPSEYFFVFAFGFWMWHLITVRPLKKTGLDLNRGWSWKRVPRLCPKLRGRKKL